MIMNQKDNRGVERIVEKRKIEIDRRTIGRVSGVVRASYDEAFATLIDNGYELISTSDYPDLGGVLATTPQHSFSNRMCVVSERVVYIPGLGAKLTKVPPTLGWAKRVVEANKEGRSAPLTDRELEDIMQDPFLVDYPLLDFFDADSVENFWRIPYCHMINGGKEYGHTLLSDHPMPPLYNSLFQDKLNDDNAKYRTANYRVALHCIGFTCELGVFPLITDAESNVPFANPLSFQPIYPCVYGNGGVSILGPTKEISSQHNLVRGIRKNRFIPWTI